MYKVCVYAICKNEEKFVDRWMDSMSEADMIVVTDTGSTDKTIEKLKQRGAIVYSEKINPWRFDTARNISLSHVPEDIDICVCTDLDEIFEKGWRDELEKKWVKEKSAIWGHYLYNWSIKKDGTPGVQFTYFKIHSRHGFKWVYPVHECIKYEGKLPLKNIFIEGVVLNHYPDNTKSRSSYLKLLEMAVDENPLDDRMMYYLGREYMYNQKWELCIKTLKKHLLLPKSTWNEERCASMRWIAKSYFEMNNIKEATSWYFKAMAEANMREAYIEFSLMMHQIENWHMTYFLINEALKIEKKSSTYVNGENAWDHTPYDLGALSCYHLGLYNEALLYAKKALDISPNDERLKSNYHIIKNRTVF